MSSRKAGRKKARPARSTETDFSQPTSDEIELADSGTSEAPLSYGLVTVIARSARLYRSALPPLAFLFAAIAIVISALSLFGLADIGRIQLFAAFLAQIVLPAILGSWGMALSTVILRERAAGRETTISSSFETLKPIQREIVVASLFASMMALWAIILLGQFGFVLMPLFFGPPILIQVIALERISVKEARGRSREIMSGYTGRTILYLVIIALAIGLLGGVALQATIAAADAATGGFLLVLIFSVMQVVVAALTMPFLAAAEYVCLESLLELKAAD